MLQTNVQRMPSKKSAPTNGPRLLANLSHTIIDGATVPPPSRIPRRVPSKPPIAVSPSRSPHRQPPQAPSKPSKPPIAVPPSRSPPRQLPLAASTSSSSDQPAPRQATKNLIIVEPSRSRSRNRNPTRTDFRGNVTRRPPPDFIANRCPDLTPEQLQRRRNATDTYHVELRWQWRTAYDDKYGFEENTERFKQEVTKGRGPLRSFSVAVPRILGIVVNTFHKVDMTRKRSISYFMGRRSTKVRNVSDGDDSEENSVVA
ncbi:unnamed protein product, partial [Mesorhabditis spiculigera]